MSARKSPTDTTDVLVKALSDYKVARRRQKATWPAGYNNVPPEVETAHIALTDTPATTLRGQLCKIRVLEIENAEFDDRIERGRDTFETAFYDAQEQCVYLTKLLADVLRHAAKGKLHPMHIG